MLEAEAAIPDGHTGAVVVKRRRPQGFKHGIGGSFCSVGPTIEQIPALDGAIRHVLSERTPITLPYGSAAGHDPGRQSAFLAIP